MRHLLVVMAITLVGQVAGQQPGALDLAFDADGKVILADFDSIGPPVLVPTEDLGAFIAFQQTVDGASLTRVVRLHEDGSLNQSFGVGGVYTTTTLGALKDMVIQSDGKPLLIGIVADGVDTGAVLQRLTELGSLDTSYGGSGRVVVIGTDDVPSTGTKGGALMPDDRLVLHLSDRIMRINIDGSVDAGFGTLGVLSVPSGVGDLAISPNGRLRWTVIGDHLSCEVGMDGQGLSDYFLSGGPSYAPDNRIYGPIATNLFNHSVGHCRGYFGNYGAVLNSGFGKTENLGPHVNPFGLEFNSGTLHWERVFISGPFLNPYVNGVLGPVAADQDGNFLVAYSYAHYEWYSPSGVTTVVPMAPVWKVKRWVPGHSQFDSAFNEGYDGPAFEIGNDARFDSTSIPVPVSMAVQPDGKVLLAGTCLVDSVTRVVVARYHNIPDPRSVVSVRVLLGGAFDSNSGLMRDDLRQQGLLPALQPYAEPDFSSINGLGSWAMPQHVLAWEGDSAVVDWVWLELLSAADSSTVVATRVGLVHRDGLVTAADDRSPIDFSAGAGSFFIRARHRNHLSVTAAQPVTLGPEPSSLDFTDPATLTFGTDAQMEEGGLHMLWPGDATGDGVVKYIGAGNDRDAILTAVGGAVHGTIAGYRPEDLNLDGVVKYVGPANDRDIILQVIDPVEPTSVRVAQQP